jgi:site-specific DNA-methyltransferase (adenine-specific)
MTYQILHGNNLDILPTLADNSIDSIVTDPPYELGFMGKKWDSSGIAYSVELWQQCLRVLKPGGHLLSFGGTRTYHRVAVAIEDSGFELRDSIAWLYGSGFPKSLDVSKAIDKAAGAERKVTGIDKVRGNAPSMLGRTDPNNPEYDGSTFGVGTTYITAPATPEAQQWQGWGTALKPAFEPVIVARKPIEGTVANNVLKWGTGGLNIDGSRIGTEQRNMTIKETGFGSNFMDDNWQPSGNSYDKTVQGRWPANIILDPYTAELLDEQSGTTVSKAGGRSTQKGTGTWTSSTGVFASGQDRPRTGHTDSGGASRFFYVAKASKRDRNEGIDLNNHPTVKPTTLMEYLIKLVTPPQGTVLDPFTGSGSTGKAAILQGFDFIGIEMTEEYLPIIEGRLKHAEARVAERIKETANQQSEVLF